MKRRTENSGNKKIMVKMFFSLLTLLFFFNNEGSSQIPDNPNIDSVSIVGIHPIISWFPNTTNTTGYSIYRGKYETVGGSTFLIWDSITSLPGITQSSHIDNQVSACTEQRLYKVRAYNATNASNWLNADTMNTILITNIDFDLCSNSISIDWVKYRNMLPQPGGYWVLASEDGGPFSVVGATSPSQNYYTHGNLTPNVNYTYKIRAFNNDETRASTSCEREITSQTYDKPAFTNIRVATVENDEHIKLTWEADDAPITKFQILRSETESNYAFLAEILGTTSTNPATTFTDTSADFSSTSYYYSIDVFDFCGKKHLTSDNIARTILITGEKTSGSEITLQWNPYEGWPGGIEKFELFQEVDGVQFPSNGPLATLSETETSHIANVSGLGGGEGNFTYYVKAYENGGNNEVSQSNKITIQFETSISIPNAIIPEGAAPDNEFKPDPKFIEQGFYSLTIYNKWGEQIFESKVLDNGWDGTYKGEYVPGGAYVYHIKYRNARGQDQEKRGTVTVIR